MVAEAEVELAIDATAVAAAAVEEEVRRLLPSPVAALEARHPP